MFSRKCELRALLLNLWCGSSTYFNKAARRLVLLFQSLYIYVYIGLAKAWNASLIQFIQVLIDSLTNGFYVGPHLSQNFGEEQDISQFSQIFLFLVTLKDCRNLKCTSSWKNIVHITLCIFISNQLTVDLFFVPYFRNLIIENNSMVMSSLYHGC